MIAFILSIPFFSSFFNPDYMTDRISWLCFVGVLFICGKIWNYSKTFSIAYLYFLTNHLYITHFHNRYYELNRVNYSMVTKSSRYFLMILIATFICFLLKKNNLKKIDSAIKLILPLSLLAQLFCYFFGIHFAHFSNPSVIMTTFSLAIAYTWHLYRPIYRNIVLVLFFSCFLFDSSIIGIFSFLCSFIFYYFVKSKEKEGYILIFIPLSVILYFINLSYPHIFDFNGRLFIWEHGLKFLIETKNYIFGFGGGTYQHFFPLYQYHNQLQYNGAYATYMHNDYLQMLFEHGIVGLSLFLIAWASMFYNLIKLNSQYLLFFVCLSINMLGNFPLQNSSDILLTMLIITKIFWEKKNGNSRISKN